MKARSARICLTVAIVWFLLGGFVSGYAPEWFVIAAGFGAVPVALGTRWVRLCGLVLVIVAVAAVIGAYQGRERDRARVQLIKGQPLPARSPP